jgi:ribosomal protein S18 acetylase RimI-like enzyme
VIIRAATPRDAASIARLHIESWRAAYRAELPDAFLDNQDVAQRTAIWEQRLNSSEMFVSLAENGDELLGFCAYGWSRDGDADKTWEIKNLHVAPELRGGGIGSVLFQAAVQAVTDTDASELTLWVVESNRPARQFYESKGMRTDGARQQHVVAENISLNEIRYRMPIAR